MKVAPSQREMYVIRHSQRAWIAYAPLHSRLLLIESTAGNQILSGEMAALEDSLRQVLTNELDSRVRMSREAEATNAESFIPRTLAISLSLNCNLRCVYCHASAAPKELDTLTNWDTIQVAIDYFLNFPHHQEHGIVSLSFAGGGEPTLEWQLLTQATRYFKEQASVRGLEAEVTMATNGTMTKEQTDFVIREFRGVSLSIDGDEEIHNSHRPAVGFNSFEATMRTAKQLSQEQFPFGVHAVVSAQSVERMPGIVDFFVDELPGLAGIGFEPVVPLGRAEGTVLQPSLSRFTDLWLEARRRGLQRGVRVFYSGGCQIDSIRPLFCSAVMGPDITITWDGHVSSCTRDNPDAHFRVGIVDAIKGEVRIDMTAVKRLKTEIIERREKCTRCFAVYHCGGECADLIYRTSVDRCRHTRRIVYAQLCEFLGIKPARFAPRATRVLLKEIP